MGVSVAMITGDSEAVAGWVARELGIAEYFAQVLPENKAARVKELQDRGSRVAMVGDGVNDAPALAQADVGFAIGAGTDVAIEAADVILVRDDPRDVVRVIALSRASYRKMLQNLAWATGYNVVALPLAAGVLASLGVVLAPAVGAVLMASEHGRRRAERAIAAAGTARSLSDPSWGRESNPRPTDYKSVALPAELPQRSTGIYRGNPRSGASRDRV